MVSEIFQYLWELLHIMFHQATASVITYWEAVVQFRRCLASIFL